MTVVAASLTAAVAIVPASAGGSASSGCAQVSFPVALAAGQPADQRIAGTLCLPRGALTSTLQLLVPGGTYGQRYWFLSGDSRHESYVGTMTGAGYATLAIDRLGSGGSSVPGSDRYTPETQEFVLYQLVQAVRAGAAGQKFGRLVLVGHSFGSTLARTIAIRHPAEIDGIVLTGEASAPAAVPWEEVVHPASEDPEFVARGVDPGYYTTRPGARAMWFYQPETADPWVMTLDELTKEPDVYTEAFPPAQDNAAIRVPVLIVVGQQDRLICAWAGSDCSSSRALHAQEKRHYPNAELQVEVIERTGHSLNLHRTAPVWLALARDWLDRHVGTAAR